MEQEVRRPEDMEECNDKNLQTFRDLKGKHINEMKTKFVSNKTLLTCSNL